MSPTAKEEKKLSVPSGHPQAGYVSPDLSGSDGVEILPDEEQKAKDERDQAREDELKAVTESEDKAAREDAKAAEQAAAKQQPAAPTTTKASSGS